MATPKNTWHARKPVPCVAKSPTAPDARPAPGYIRLYRRALIRNELLLNIAATSRPVRVSTP